MRALWWTFVPPRRPPHFAGVKDYACFRVLSGERVGPAGPSE